jgi:hypothetical protein
VIATNFVLKSFSFHSEFDFVGVVQFGDPPLRVVLNLLNYATYSDAATWQV